MKAQSISIGIRDWQKFAPGGIVDVANLNAFCGKFFNIIFHVVGFNYKAINTSGRHIREPINQRNTGILAGEAHLYPLRATAEGGLRNYFEA